MAARDDGPLALPGGDNFVGRPDGEAPVELGRERAPVL